MIFFKLFTFPHYFETINNFLEVKTSFKQKGKNYIIKHFLTGENI